MYVYVYIEVFIRQNSRSEGGASIFKRMATDLPFNLIGPDISIGFFEDLSHACRAICACHLTGVAGRVRQAKRAKLLSKATILIEANAVLVVVCCRLHCDFACIAF